MGDIAALRGIWNIVPTPFLPSGELDLASIPGLVAFVRGTGVDGMTILGVLGEAGRMGDAERSAVIAAVLACAASSVPVIDSSPTSLCTSRSYAFFRAYGPDAP